RHSVFVVAAARARLWMDCRVARRGVRLVLVSVPMITGSPLFELRGVEFAYDDGSVALRGVGLEIYAAEKIAVIGANGSGKSSLLKILDGLLWPQRGSVRFRGEALTEASLRSPKTNAAFRSAVGFV